jgi:hypothetical protein
MRGVSVKLFDHFKALCALRGLSVKDQIIELMKKELIKEAKKENNIFGNYK